MFVNRFRALCRPAAALALLGAAFAGGAQPYFVDADATGACDGSSWTDAWTDLQTALASVPNNSEVWVAEGTYLPGDSVQHTFSLRKRVALYGGFRGTETARAQRDWTAHRTVLSGDLNQDDVYGGVIWYSGWNINTPNAEHVVSALNVDRTAVLDGFEVRAGYNAFASGGGLYAVAGEGPTVANVTFTRNEAGFSNGGGAFVLDCSPLFEGCTFLENYVHAGMGGGMCSYGSARPEVRNCRFEANICVGASSNSTGAGWSHYTWEPVILSGCTFVDNDARWFYSAGSQPSYGGGFFTFADSLVVTDCRFEGNHANVGGGLFSFGEGHRFVNCAFIANTCTPRPSSSGVVDYGDYGAGVAISTVAPSVYPAADFLHCTFTGNVTGEGAGLYGSGLRLRNSVVWGNIGTGSEVPTLKAQVSGDADFFYSLVEGLLDSIPGEDPPNPADFPGCLDTDPLLDAGFRPGPGSPCIDAGNAAYLADAPTTDLAGNVRAADDPSVPDTGAGTAPLPDLGAWEVVQPCSAATPPGGLQSSPVSPVQVALSWAVLPSAEGYQVEGGPLGGGTGRFTTTATDRAVGGLVPGGSYAWRVRARCTDGVTLTPWSVHDTFTLPTARETLAVLPLRADGDRLLLPGLTAADQLLVVDLAGRPRFAGPASATLDVSAWPAGLYLLRATAPDGTVRAGRFARTR